jgi:hypothetical protein
MPYQVGVTIRAEVSPDQLPPLRKWLADTGRKGLTEPPFDFAHLRGVHFARLYLLDEVADLDGRPIPAGLVFMSEVDAPLRRHLAQLIDVAGDGIDQAFAHCAGYPGPGARRRTRIAWLRRHLVPASAYYVNTRRRSCGTHWRIVSTRATGRAGPRPGYGRICRTTWPAAAT